MFKLAFYILTLLVMFPCNSESIHDTYERGKKQFHSNHLQDAKNTLGIIKKTHSSASYLYTFTLTDGTEFIYSHQQLISLMTSAKLGNLYALESLIQEASLIDESRKLKLKSLLLKILNEDIKNYNINAMVLMARFYQITDHEEYIHWTKKAASYEHAPSQYKLASYYEDGNDFFFFEKNREEKIVELYAKSASEAYSPAMRYFAFHKQNTPKKTRMSLISALLEQGDKSTIAALCREYSSDNGTFKKNILKAASFCKIYIKSISKEKKALYITCT